MEKLINNEEVREDRFAGPRRISWWDQDILEKSNVLVVGAGTLGNEVCKNLALLGIGNITVIDNDVVEIGNLSRSVLMREEDVKTPPQYKSNVVAKRMKELYSKINVTPIVADVVRQYGNCNYKKFNLVLMTVDNLEARIYINRFCQLWRVPLIDGGLDGLLCNVQVIIPPETACYECGLGDSDYKRLSQKYSCGGLMKNAPDRKIPMVITSSAIAAGLMTQEAIKILHGVQPILSGKKAILDGNTNEFNILSINRVEDCYGHYELNPEKLLILDFTNEITLKDLKKLIRKEVDQNVRIYHDNTIIYSGKCNECGYSKDLFYQNINIKEINLICDKCGSQMWPDLSGQLKNDEDTLANHGVPDNHLLTLYFDDGGCKYLASK
ncbi:MAG TPA: hypothetical protein DCX03_07520 [Bacteroidales bacterium]|nr:hypothetical protein [Bacteroidales bacterium]